MSINATNDARTTFILAMTGKTHSELIPQSKDNCALSQARHNSVRIHYPKDTRSFPHPKKRMDIPTKSSDIAPPIFPPPAADGVSIPYLDRMSASHAPLDAGDTKGLTIDQNSQQHVVQRKEGDGPHVDMWRQAHAPPSSLPNLDHTGVRTPFTYQGPTFMRPDGTIGIELRNDIRNQFSSIPHLPIADPNDMTQVDYEKSVTRAMALEEVDAEEEELLRLQGTFEEQGEEGEEEMKNYPEKKQENCYSVRPQNMAKHGAVSLERNFNHLSNHEPSKLEITSNEGTLTTMKTNAMKKKVKKVKVNKKLQQQQQSNPRKKKPFNSDSLFDCLLDMKFGKTDAKSLNNLSNTLNKDGEKNCDWDVTSFRNSYDVHLNIRSPSN